MSSAILSRPAAVLALCAGLALGAAPAARAQMLPRPVKAPELDGATGTLGADRPLLLKDLRCKVVVIEFWTLC